VHINENLLKSFEASLSRKIEELVEQPTGYIQNLEITCPHLFLKYHSAVSRHSAVHEIRYQEFFKKKHYPVEMLPTRTPSRIKFCSCILEL